jgi:hypothetical protein
VSTAGEEAVDAPARLADLGGGQQITESGTQRAVEVSA